MCSADEPCWLLLLAITNYLLLFLVLATALNSALLPSSGSLDQEHFLYLLTLLTRLTC